MKKTLRSLLLFSISIICLLQYCKVKTVAIPFEPNGNGMVLMDYITGEIIAEKNSHMRMAPASTTKTMTALLTLEKCNLQDIVTVGNNPPLVDGSSIGLKEGDKYTIEELLYALLLESSNDSAVALAEHIAGSEENFAKMMTERAKLLGANDTYFVNASGLYDENHYTTPYDLALIMKEVSKNSTFLEICKKRSHEMPASIIDNQTKWVNNKNLLLAPNSQYYYEPILCSKTGYTIKANHTYVAVAEKDGQKLILSLLDYPDKFEYYKDVKSIFDYGFNNFKTIKLYDKGHVVSQYNIDETNSIPLTLSNDLFYVANKNDLHSINLNNINNELNIKFDANATIPIKKGQDILQTDEIFSGNLTINGKYIKSVPLSVKENITYTNFEKFITALNNHFVVPLLFISMLIFLFFFIPYKRNKLRKNNKKIY